jgi:hypothetical protein
MPIHRLHSVTVRVKSVVSLLVFAGGAILGFPQATLEQGVAKNAVEEFTKTSVAFTENRGQWRDDVLFRARQKGAAFFFCRNEVTYLFLRSADESFGEKTGPLPMMSATPEWPECRGHSKEALIIEAQFVGSNAEPEIITDNLLPHRCNYFYGNDSDTWVTGVRNYSGIVYKQLWPGIDLAYHSGREAVKYDLIVHPGADISEIRIRYIGIQELAVSKSGDLEIRTSYGRLYEKKPYIYQEIDGMVCEISGRYTKYGPNVFGFELDELYNRTEPVLIDPELVYSTFLGGADIEWPGGISVDSSGSVYVMGSTASVDFPVAHPYDGSYNGGTDVFITKLSSSGDSLVYSTFLGGPNQDLGSGIDIDDSGNTYLTGQTMSADFPTVNAYDNSYNGEGDVFVAKLSPTGDSLLYCTFLGGSDYDFGRNIVVDSDHRTHVTGESYSSDFPLVNPFDETNNDVDAFLTRLSASGDSILYSTYLGGTGGDGGWGIAVNIFDETCVVGQTLSSDFPTVNPYDDSHNGHFDVFVAKFSTSDDSFIYSTYLGGGNEDRSFAVGLDNSGCAYVTGIAKSPDFPMVNPYDATMDGDWDAFVTKFSQWGDSLQYSTFLGGGDHDSGWGIAVDSSGRAFITGITLSSDFPVQNPFDGSFNGGSYWGDAFVTEFSPSGHILEYSTYIGGTDEDLGHDIALGAFGDFHVVGETWSSDFPILNAYDESLGGNNDAFILKFVPDGTRIDENDVEIPLAFLYLHIYPNPFNAATAISYTLPEQGDVSISIYNLLGQRVATIFEGTQEAGEHTITWDARDFPSGVYFARLEAGGHSENIKMVLLK